MIISSLRFLDSGRPYGLFQENRPSEKRPVFVQSNWLNLFKNTTTCTCEAHSSVPKSYPKITPKTGYFGPFVPRMFQGNSKK